MKRVNEVFFFLLFGLIVIGVQSQGNNVLVLNDIHLDPLNNPEKYNQTTYCRPPTSEFATIPGDILNFWKGRNIPLTSVGSSLGRYGCDSSVSLVQSVFSNAKSFLSKPDFILFIGDAIAHNIHNEVDRNKAWNYVHSFFETYYPSVPVVPTIGNNDLPIDYDADCNSEGLLNLATDWNKCGWLPDDQISNFKIMGSYSKLISNGNIRVLSLNSNVFSYQAKRTQNASSLDCGQLAWLENQLYNSELKSENVIILCHIPPAIDSFSSKSLWDQKFVDVFLNSISKHKSIIKAIFTGHIHRDEFRILRSSIGILTGPAISPCYASNPSFKLANINKTSGNLLDLTSVFLDLKQAIVDSTKTDWKIDYSFTSTYKVPDVSMGSLELIKESISNSSQSFSEWRNRASGHYSSDEKTVLCAITATSFDQYNQCLSTWT